MVMQVLFWLLLILCVIGVFVPDENKPYIGRSRIGIALILIAILGFKVFDAPWAK